MTRPFRGTFNLDLKESTEDWDAFSRAGHPRAHRTWSWFSTTPYRMFKRYTASAIRW